MRTTNITILCVTLVLAAAAAGQEPPPPGVGPSSDQAATSDRPAGGSEAKPFSRAAGGARQQLDESLAELSSLREEITAEKLPLSRRLKDLESELIRVRQEYQQTSRTLDSRTLDLTNLRDEIGKRKEEATYLSNLLGEYIRGFESRLHIAEVRRYREVLDGAKQAPENRNLSQQEVFAAQTGLVSASLERLHEAVGGARFAGEAVCGPEKLQKSGVFVLLGPAAIFRSDDGQYVGTAEQQLNSLEPVVVAFNNPADSEAAAGVVVTSAGQFPLDPTLGSAHKIEATEESLWEHIQKGGPVMYPILTLAGLAALVAILKWLTLSLTPKPSQKRINELLQAVGRGDAAKAGAKVKTIRGPVGRMLSAGVAHLGQPRELIEEVMYETILSTRLKLNRLLPFVAISASSAPLLGLLGTVTGIINTFKLITVFGSGDVKTLSGGISEALITTEYGLIVAIPSLLMYAFLSRKARGIVDQMEKAGLAFVNQVSKGAGGGDEPAADPSGPAAPAAAVARPA